MDSLSIYRGTVEHSWARKPRPVSTPKSRLPVSRADSSATDSGPADRLDRHQRDLAARVKEDFEYVEDDVGVERPVE